jgi:diguanylate cyclase (GGDEF)-like protein
MSSSDSKQLTDQQIEDVINMLDAADASHREWLWRFHAGLICEPGMDDDIMDEQAHTLCKFGHWYYHYASPILTRQQAFIDVERLHADMHATARQLALKSSNGTDVSQEDYRAFIEKQRVFADTMKILRDQMYERLYSYDKLTGLMTRGPFMAILDGECAREGRTGEQCCLVLMDIDHFKEINDEYGHLAGDRVLINVARYLRKHMRPYDSICRYGGEEFLIALPNTDMQHAQEIIERIRHELEQLKIEYESGHCIHITASFGISSLRKADGYQFCLKCADDALYRAKALGRNKVCVV